MLNELLQGQRPIGQGVDWFEALTAEGQFRDPPGSGGHCIQARATWGARECAARRYPADAYPGGADHTWAVGRAAERKFPTSHRASV